jgi:phosphatidylinositol glycan class M
MTKPALNITFLALLSGLVHAVLIVYGEWQDSHMRVSYTDIDYWVYSDAARHVFNGASAFDRHTYRYTPLLAWLLVPNEMVGMWWGKALFSLAGVISGVLIYRITNRNLAYASLWLFSPVTINISTRGSSDSLIILLILLVFHELKFGRLNWAAVWFGLSVHLRIFPIFFVIPIMAHLRWDVRKIFVFGIISGGLCLGLIGLFYIKDGFRFVYEAYLYHFVRKDHRHNFSIFYYPIYLASSASEGSLLSKVLTFSGFVPQLGSLVFVGLRFGGQNFMFAIFLQTIIFVAFNKVITAQVCWYCINFKIFDI